uniref:Sanpodo n=1 Tax=Glossina morsitans morsitans TaxID=37546 RepID=A0A1B0FAK6_GLOMM
MSKHNYTNPAFCQSSEFYPVPSAKRNDNIEDIYNRSLLSNYTPKASTALSDPCDGPLRIQRSMSTRSMLRQKAVSFNNPLQREQQQQQGTQKPRLVSDGTVSSFDTRSGSGRYAIVPVEELPAYNKKSYTIISDPDNLDLCLDRHYAKSHNNLENLKSPPLDSPEEREPHSFHEDPRAYPFTSSQIGIEPSTSSKKSRIFLQNRQPSQTIDPSNIKHAFSSDFSSKTFMLVDKNSNQRYQMVPTAENEELVDDNHEVIQMHNGKAHRYAVIPTEDTDNDDEYDISQDPENNTEEETCLSTSDLNKSRQCATLNGERNRSPICTSTPQKVLSGANHNSFPNTPMKNLAATKMLQEILSTPPRNAIVQRSFRSQPNTPRPNFIWSSQRDLNAPHPDTPRKNSQLSPQRLYYESVKPMVMTQTLKQNERDRTMAVIQPRLATCRQTQSQVEEEVSGSIQAKSFDNSLYPQKIANATVTLAIVSLMLVLGSSMNLGLIVYMIARLGKSFYLQFSLMAAFCGFGLGFLGFRSRHCEWLPNRSYISGYVLLTIFCLLKCCALLVILVLDPYPGLPLHDVTTGVILALSTFSMFFIGLGVIGSLWCYRPPPDNRVNIV